MNFIVMLVCICVMDVCGVLILIGGVIMVCVMDGVMFDMCRVMDVMVDVIVDGTIGGDGRAIGAIGDVGHLFRKFRKVRRDRKYPFCCCWHRYRPKETRVDREKSHHPCQYQDQKTLNGYRLEAPIGTTTTTTTTTPNSWG